MEAVKSVEMTSLLPTLRVLKREEKLFLIQFLASELAQQENMSLLPNMDYPVWSPFDAFEAADIMLHVLNENRPIA